MSVTFDQPMDPDLPVLSEDPPERADAARNRGKVLAAAERLFAERGPSRVSMDAVAAEAGVGKGTLFRRFGDRAGLALGRARASASAASRRTSSAGRRRSARVRRRSSGWSRSASACSSTSPTTAT